MLRDKIAMLLLAAIIAVGYCIPTARADGLPTKSGIGLLNTTEKASSWNGFWVSAGGAYSWQGTEVSGDGDLDGKNFDINRALATVGAGWNYQFGNMVAGLMADASFGNLKASYDSKNVYDVDWQWFAGARLGILAAPRILIYGLAGYTHNEGDSFDFSSVSPGADRKLRDIKGLTLGAGSEVMLDGSWTAKLEYRWVNGGSGDVNIPDDGSGNLQEMATDIHQVRAVIVYRFGGVK